MHNAVQVLQVRLVRLQEALLKLADALHVLGHLFGRLGLGERADAVASDCEPSGAASPPQVSQNVLELVGRYVGLPDGPGNDVFEDGELRDPGQALDEQVGVACEVLQLLEQVHLHGAATDIGQGACAPDV